MCVRLLTGQYHRTLTTVTNKINIPDLTNISRKYSHKNTDKKLVGSVRIELTLDKL